MSLNSASQSNFAVDVIDQCIRKSEVMPGQYKNITSPSYSNNCQIDVCYPSPNIGTNFSIIFF